MRKEWTKNYEETNARQTDTWFEPSWKSRGAISGCRICENGRWRWNGISFGRKRVTSPFHALGAELSWPRALYRWFTSRLKFRCTRPDLSTRDSERGRGTIPGNVPRPQRSFTAFALYIARRCASDKTICNNPLNSTIHGYLETRAANDYGDTSAGEKKWRSFPLRGWLRR